MAVPVVRHAGARHVVITDLNPFRLDLARKMGATLAMNTNETPLDEVQKRLGMTEGFDVGLEMSGNAHALGDMIANMSHGGKIAILGIPAKEIDNGLAAGNLQHAHHQGHLRARDVRDLVQDVGDARVRPGYFPVITHRFPWNEFEAGLPPCVQEIPEK